MTLDPVHVDGIAALADRLGGTVSDDDHDRLAERVWDGFLDPLRDDGTVVIEPIADQRRHRIEAESVALLDPPFPTSHGLDAGTLNPTTYRNGTVVDVAHAAMAREPSDHDLHRSRSIVAAAHVSEDRSIDEAWSRFDDGYCREKWIATPAVERFAEAVTHSLALYSAESEHALAHLEAVEDLLLLDGPIYPKELLRWQDRHRELRDRLVSESLPREIVTNYLDLVAAAREAECPLAGFVKNPSSNRLTRTLRRAGLPAPWRNDAGLFRRILAPGDDPDEDPHLAYTNWFHSRAGTDGTFATDGGILDLEVPAGAGVTFMAILDPRDGTVYRVEAPAWVTEDADRRDRLTRMVLRGVAAERGPPRAIAKADALARIGRAERRSLREVIATRWETDVDRTYDDRRWGMW